MTKKKCSLKKRGIKGSLGVEEQLSLTLCYLRHYATFLILGQFFGTSESRCHKIYKKITGYLVKILDMPDRKLLLNGSVENIAIDVTEQRMERLGQHQKDCYSGKTPPQLIAS
ncbi:MAG: transposase family protein [Methylococcales bacterium]